MLERYSFLIVFTILLSGLGWWSKKIEAVTAPASAASEHAQSETEATTIETTKRRELIEVLDRVVAYEHYYRSVYGHFTQLLSRVGFPIPAHVGSVYEIRIAEASTEKLLVTAFSEVKGRVADRVSVDQSFQVQANFPIPLPRPEYLKIQALKQLRTLRDAPSGQMGDEQGIFRNFFRFEVRRDSQDRKIAFAVGQRPPVVGMRLEAGPGQESDLAQEADPALRSLAELAQIPELMTPATGQRVGEDLAASTDQVNLAQTIFHGEMGRFAKTWSELSKIARFRTDDAPQASVADSAVDDKNSRKPAQEAAPGGPALEIEPVTSEE